MAWLKCQVRDSVFDDEVIAGVKTLKGRRHIFADRKLIREHGGHFELLVKELPSPCFHKPNCKRIRLPVEPIEGGALVIVESEDVTSYVKNSSSSSSI